MRQNVLAALVAALPLAALAAPTWQTVSSEQGKRIELDRTSIKREDGGKVQATGRIILDKEILDVRSGGTYRLIEATTRYDCASRNAATIKRVFKKNETEVLREEEQPGAELPVRSGTLDDKVLREVCRPVKAGKEPADSRAEAAKAAPIKVVERISHGDEQALAANSQGTAPRLARKSRAAAQKKAHGDDMAREALHVHWSYEGDGGPENWHRLDPKNRLCATGQRQSPIDIRDGVRVDLEPIGFSYQPSHFSIVDNGHTVQVKPGEGSLTITGKTYHLVQFHFHRPSEEKINGQRFDMVAHLVHKSDDGNLAVVAVLMERGPENPFIQALWNNLPLDKNVEVQPPDTVVDLNTFLPATRNYYTYMGSLTTPPCSEGVLWLVLRQPVSVSAEQVGVFSRLYKNNVRPIQPAAGRLVKEGR